MRFKVEQLVSDLPASLLPCPQCFEVPQIVRKEQDWKITVGIFCPRCPHYYAGGNKLLYPTDMEWCDSLYEAVSVWQTTAKILGSREKREESMSEHAARKFEAFREAVLNDVIDGFDPP